MRLVLSGGGTGGHIIPNIALIQELKRIYPEEDQLALFYIGTKNGLERKLITELNIPYQAISCGKLRRYFSFQNFIDFFKLPIGVIQAFFAIRRFKPQVIFCKGGYVSFPVALAGKLLKIPVVLHESDVTPGLANRLCARFASIICISFPESEAYFRPQGKKKKYQKAWLEKDGANTEIFFGMGTRETHSKKNLRWRNLFLAITAWRGVTVGGTSRSPHVILTGNPVRRELALGNKEDGLRFTDFQDEKPTLLFMGGSQGAEFINELVYHNFSYLLKYYQIIHICGEGKVKQAGELLTLLSPDEHTLLTSYRAFAFVGSQLKNLYALADVIIARAGAVTLAEIDFFNKPAVLIPLPAHASRGDQIDNAKAYIKTHPARLLLQPQVPQEDFHEELRKSIQELLAVEVKKQPLENKFSALEKIVGLLREMTGER